VPPVDLVHGPHEPNPPVIVDAGENALLPLGVRHNVADEYTRFGV